MEEEKKISFNLIVSLIIVFLCGMYYYFSRGYVSNLKDFLMMGDELMPPISAGTFSSITSAFSISYGLGQPIGGILLDKLGIKYLSPLLLLGAALGTYGFSNYIDPTIAVYIRYFIGICFCVSTTGANKYFSMLWSKHFTVLVNLLPVSMCLSAALASSGFIRNLMVKMGWRCFLKNYGILGMILSVALFVVLSLVLKTVIKKNEHMEFDNVEINSQVEVKTNLDSTNNVSIMSGIKELIFLPGFIFVALFSVAISSAAYTLMEGWGNSLLGLKFPHLSASSLALPATINNIGNAFGFLYNIWADRFTIKKQMLIYGIIGLASLGAIVYINLPFMGFLVCCFFLGFTCAAQNIGFVFLQRKLSNKYLGLGFGLLNFLCMFFGCALVQKIAGILLDLLKKNSISGGIQFYEGYRYIDLINMFKFLFIPGIIALLAVFFFKENEETKS
jgi:MFS family permease